MEYAGKRQDLVEEPTEFTNTTLAPAAQDGPDASAQKQHPQEESHQPEHAEASQQQETGEMAPREAPSQPEPGKFVEADPGWAQMVSDLAQEEGNGTAQSNPGAGELSLTAAQEANAAAVPEAATAPGAAGSAATEASPGDKAQPAGVGMPAGHDFTVLLVKDVETKLGMAVLNYEGPEGAWLKVQDIGQGLVGNWNAAHPDQEVKRDDLIWQVNGAGGTVENIVTECRKSEALELKVRRPTLPS